MTNPTGTAPGRRARPRRGADLRRHAWWLGPAAAILVVLVGAWRHRWTNDDAFINFRVIDQFLAGHGPVFNQGERVEVTTSPLWAALVGAVHVVTRVRMEWVALVLGMATTAAAMALGAVGARHLHGAGSGGGAAPVDGAADGDDDATGSTDPGGAPHGPAVGHAWWLPAGLAVFAALPVVWDYTTGGLENGASWLWWATAFTTAVRATVGDRPGRPAVAAFAAGLGPLVRPDLGLPAAAFIGLVVVPRLRARPGGAVPTLARLGLAAGALPVVYQVFRMGYYGQLLPNTVYAKEGGLSWWGQGWRYLGNLVSPYVLWLPALALVLLAVALLGRGAARPRGWLAALATAEGAALAHALLVVRAGGDYMHGRLLTPALFGLLVPVFVLPVRRAPGLVAGRSTRTGPRFVAVGALVVVLAGWSVAAATSLRTTDTAFEAGVFDNRQFTVDGTGVAHPVLVEHHTAYLTDRGVDLEGFGEDLDPFWAPEGVLGARLEPLAPGRGTVVSASAIGALPYRLPLDVHVADTLGLADPVVAHVRLEHRGLPGHEKFLRRTWWAARILPDGDHLPGELNDQEILVVGDGAPASDDPAVVAREQDDADAALGCGDLARLRDATTAELTPGRFLRNLAGAPGLHGFRFDRTPSEARRALCGG